FAAFDNSKSVESGKPNYPANHVSFERAKAYCDWLSKLTGETYRLPTEKEAETLYEKAATSENTLDYWAGYAINPDDAVKIQQEIARLTGKAPLLKEVGSFAGSGSDDVVFDLGGNVAEWVVTKGGKGKPMGGSADTPADAQAAHRKPAPGYVGFRVLKNTRQAVVR